MKRRQKKQENTSDRNIKLIVAVVLIALFLVFIKYSDSDTSNSQYPASSQLTGEVKNGEQYIQLSWGKLNYEPKEIVVKAGMPVKLSVDLKRIRGCYRSFQIEALKIRKFFSERDNLLEFTPQIPGVYKFSCTMNMGTGRLRVIE